MCQDEAHRHCAAPSVRLNHLARPRVPPDRPSHWLDRTRLSLLAKDCQAHLGRQIARIRMCLNKRDCLRSLPRMHQLCDLTKPWPHTRRLTLDKSGDWKRVKHAGRRPLDERVRRLMEHGLLASHKRQFATPDRRETGCLELNEPSNERTPPQSSNDFPTRQGTSRRLVPLLACEHR